MNLSAMQTRILEYLRSHPGWHQRDSMIAAGVGKTNYARAIGHHIHPAPRTLLDRGLVAWRDGPGNTIEYSAT